MAAQRWPPGCWLQLGEEQSCCSMKACESSAAFPFFIRSSVPESSFAGRKETMAGPSRAEGSSAGAASRAVEIPI